MGTLLESLARGDDQPHSGGETQPRKKRAERALEVTAEHAVQPVRWGRALWNAFTDAFAAFMAFLSAVAVWEAVVAGSGLVLSGERWFEMISEVWIKESISHWSYGDIAAFLALTVLLVSAIGRIQGAIAAKEEWSATARDLSYPDETV